MEQILAMGTDQARSKFDAMCQIFFKRFETLIRTMEDQSAVGVANVRRVLNEGAPASSMELDLPRVRGAHGEDGGAGSSGAEEERKRPLSNSPSRHSMEEDTL